MDKIEIKRISTAIDSGYITEPLHKDTILKILEDSDSTLYRLYLISSSKDEMKYFAELEGDTEGYSFTAYVKTIYAFGGVARDQLDNIGHRKSLMHKRPLYTVKCQMTDLFSNITLFKYTHEVTSQKRVYNSMETCLNELKIILDERVNAIG